MHHTILQGCKNRTAIHPPHGKCDRETISMGVTRQKYIVWHSLWLLHEQQINPGEKRWRLRDPAEHIQHIHRLTKGLLCTWKLGEHKSSRTLRRCLRDPWVKLCTAPPLPAFRKGRACLLFNPMVLWALAYTHKVGGIEKKPEPPEPPVKGGCWRPLWRSQEWKWPLGPDVNRRIPDSTECMRNVQNEGWKEGQFGPHFSCKNKAAGWWVQRSWLASHPPERNGRASHLIPSHLNPVCVMSQISQ